MTRAVSNAPTEEEQQSRKSLPHNSAPPGTRTPNLLIKSQLLYQLS